MLLNLSYLLMFLVLSTMRGMVASSVAVMSLIYFMFFISNRRTSFSTTLLYCLLRDSFPSSIVRRRCKCHIRRGYANT